MKRIVRKTVTAICVAALVVVAVESGMCAGYYDSPSLTFRFYYVTAKEQAMAKILSSAFNVYRGAWDAPYSVIGFSGLTWSPALPRNPGQPPGAGWIEFSSHGGRIPVYVHEALDSRQISCGYTYGGFVKAVTVDGKYEFGLFNQKIDIGFRPLSDVDLSVRACGNQLARFTSQLFFTNATKHYQRSEFWQPFTTPTPATQNRLIYNFLFFRDACASYTARSVYVWGEKLDRVTIRGMLWNTFSYSLYGKVAGERSWWDAQYRISDLGLAAVGYFLDNAYGRYERIGVRNLVLNLLAARNMPRYPGANSAELAPYLAATTWTYGRWYGGISSFGYTPNTLTYDYKVYWQYK